MLQKFCCVKGSGVLLAEEGNEAGVELTAVDIVQFLGDAVKEIVGDRHQGTFEALGSEGFAAMLEGEAIAVVDIKASSIEDALLEEGLELGMAVPGVEVGLGKVGKDIAEVGEGELVLLAKLGEVGEKMEGKATGASTEFTQVEGLGTGEILGLILPVGEDYFSIGDRNGGITSNVVGDFALGPGVEAALGEVVPLESPQ